MRVVLLALLALFAGACSQDPPDRGCGDGGASGCLTDGRNGTFQCSGGIRTERLCQRQDRCSLGECLPVICRADLFSCDGEVADVCDPTGTRHTRTDCAAAGGKCVVGALTADCEVQTCTPSTTYCAPDSSEVRKCGPDGHSFDVVQVCDDPKQRGVTCAGSACRDRCTLHEAKDRSTVGCRFTAAAPSTGFTGLMLTNPNLDLPAEIIVKGALGGTQTVTVPPGGFTQLTTMIDPGSGTSLARRALFVSSTVPIQAWLGLGGGIAIHPEHTLSTRTLVGLDGTGGHRLATAAAFDNSVVTISVSGATLAGTGIPALSAGGSLTRTLQRGDVLTLESGSTATQNGARVESTLPVAVTIGHATRSTALPGADTLGRDVAVLHGALIVASAAATVTTERDGTLTLAAGQTAVLSSAQRIHATQPVLVVDAGGAVVAPVEQWGTTTYSTHMGGAFVGAMPMTITGTTTTHTLAPAQSGSYAFVETFDGGPQRLSAAAPFFGLAVGGATPMGYGLAVLP